MPDESSHKAFFITKSSGDKVDFSFEKLRSSLIHSGAHQSVIDHIINTVYNELYAGITTGEIYERAFAMLKEQGGSYASKYKLKRAIYELGPTGFPFEKFIRSILTYSGYSCETNITIEGSCVNHEIDVVARKNGMIDLIECKFHAEQGKNCDVKIPMYINSRHRDVRSNWEHNRDATLQHFWLVTNTRFTGDALQFGKCVGLYLLSWDYPPGDSLKERIDRLRLYPITVSTTMTSREKKALLDEGIVLCRELMEDTSVLQKVGISKKRKVKIIEEIKNLCHK
ncbi:ATPase [Robertkochia solimangrovi]|uniref:ATPase n=1 Tax=Robertkochia solimangrovi TaxID=2213046 RepID=UPI00117C8FA7|nr:ATPase [Robertkochia solimangrovi]TRZ41995.1 ATPase [Robertkochia solimangrovi]